MTERNIGEEVLQGIREYKAFERGELKLKTIERTMPSKPELIRSKLKLSQSAFAGLMGVSKRTLQEWEQGRRKPAGPAVALLRVAEQHPEVFLSLK